MRAGGPSSTEATALALLSLTGAVRAGDPLRRGSIRWLQEHQRADGAWPFSRVVPEASWVTSVASLALLRATGQADASVRGAVWLLAQSSWRPSIGTRIRRRFYPETKVVDLNDELRGWAWTDGAFSWIEPTAHAILALRALRGHMPAEQVVGRVREAEAMIRDRVCEGGGWNYGNSRVLDEVLWPYPDTTALALIALHDGPRDAIVTDSLHALRRMLEENDSGLAVALSILAFRLYDEDVRELSVRLRENVKATQLLGETRSLALAALALDERRHPFDMRPPA